MSLWWNDPSVRRRHKVPGRPQLPGPSPRRSDPAGNTGYHTFWITPPSQYQLMRLMSVAGPPGKLLAGKIGGICNVGGFIAERARSESLSNSKPSAYAPKFALIFGGLRADSEDGDAERR